MSETLEWLRAELLERWPVYVGILGALVLLFFVLSQRGKQSKTGKVKRTARGKGKAPRDPVNNPEDFEARFRGARERIQAAIQEKEVQKAPPVE
jgi:hypothetical protein